MFPVQLPHVGAEGDAPLSFGSIVMLKAPYFEDDSTARVAEGRLIVLYYPISWICSQLTDFFSRRQTFLRFLHAYSAFALIRIRSRYSSRSHTWRVPKSRGSGVRGPRPYCAENT